MPVSPAPSTLGDLGPFLGTNLQVPWFEVTDRRFGAKGDGVTDDTAASGAALTVGAGAQVVMPHTANGYLLSRSVPGDIASGCLPVRSGTRLLGANTKLVLNDTTSFIRIAATWDAKVTITADVAAADTTLTIADSSTYAIGNLVFIRLGTAPYDANEPDFWLFANITAIGDSTHITIDRPAGSAMSVGSTVAGNRSVQKVSGDMQDVVIDGFDLYNSMAGAANAEYGIRVTGAKNVSITNLVGTDPGSGLVSAQLCENLTLDNLRVNRSTKQLANVNKGRGLSFAECRNVSIGEANLHDCEGPFISLEGRCESVVIDRLYLQNGFPSRSVAQAFLNVIGKSKLQIGDLWIHGVGASTPLWDFGGTTGNDVKINNLYLYTGTDPTIPDLSRVTGFFYARGALYPEIKTVTKTFGLWPNMSGVFFGLPSGFSRRIKVFASSTTGITSFILHSLSNTADLKANLSTGNTVVLAQGSGWGPGYNFNSDTSKALLISTDGTVPVGAYLQVEWDYYVDPAASAALDFGGDQFVGTASVTSGTGVPGAATPGLFYVRKDGGGAGATHIYFNNAGTWLGIA
jgi:hypothetical protein